MVKNKTGGKGHKKQKNHDSVQKEFPLAEEEGEDYGIILKRLGNGVILVQKPYLNKKDKEKYQSLGIIRGAIRKSKFFVGDLVLYSSRGDLNAYSKEKLDILYKYESRDIRVIKKSCDRPEINNLLKAGADSYVNKYDDENEFEFDDTDDFVYADTVDIAEQQRRYEISDDEDENLDIDDI